MLIDSTLDACFCVRGSWEWEVDCLEWGVDIAGVEASGVQGGDTGREEGRVNGGGDGFVCGVSGGRVRVREVGIEEEVGVHFVFGGGGGLVHFGGSVKGAGEGVVVVVDEDGLVC